MIRKQELLDALESMWVQFSIRSYVKGKPILSDAGLSSLETARSILIEYRRINRNNGFPDKFVANETTGFAPMAPWRSKQQTAGFGTFGRKEGKK